jgi:membrane-associated protein
VHFDITQLIQSFGSTVGYVVLTAIIFAESGLFFGFFLPGDSLLFTAGFLASQGFFNIAILTVLMFTAAIGGDSVGYWFGKKVGKKLFSREDSRLFKKKHLESAHKFYEKHGAKTIFFARFIPAVRTFAPIVAGAADMSYKTFISYNLFGGLVWGAGMTLGGYFLGKAIPNVDRYLIPIIAIIIFTSVLPAVWHALSDKDTREHLRLSLVNFIYALPGLHSDRKS